MQEIFGDYYYTKMEEEEAFEKALTFMEGVVNSKEEIDQFIQDIMPKKMPEDGPLWRIWL